MWGLSKVILEADSVAVHLICHDVNNLQPLGSVSLGCQEIMNEVWDCKIITLIGKGIWWLTGWLTWALRLSWV